MNQAIRSAWVVAIGMFALVLGSLTFVQFFQAEDLTENPWNSRQLYQEFGRQRGALLVDGRAIAESVPSNDQFNYQRVYNEPDLYAHLTGYYSLSLGSSRLELAETEILSGTDSSLFYDRVVRLFSGVDAQGANVELTIDPEIQRLAFDLIPEGQRGSIVVLEPSTGNILAMASKPTYDPNLLAGHDTGVIAENAAALSEQPGLSFYTNPATQSLVSPGSVFKLIDAAVRPGIGPLRRGVPDPESARPRVPGHRVLPAELRRWWLCEQADGGPGVRTRAVLQHGVRADRPGSRRGGHPGTGCSVRLRRDVRHPDRRGGGGFPSDLSEPELAQSAVGQFDTRVTPLQMAMVAATIANDGQLMKPRLVKSIRAADLELIESPQPELMRQSVSQETADQLTDWMVNVVDNGTATGAQVPGVAVAGKTGTAEFSDVGDNAWFTGFAPADDPQVAISIVMENVDIPTGQQLTSPSAKRLIEAVLNR